MVALGVLSGGSFGAPSVATLYAVAMLTGAGIATLVGGLALALRGARDRSAGQRVRRRLGWFSPMYLQR